MDYSSLIGWVMVPSGAANPDELRYIVLSVDKDTHKCVVHNIDRNGNLEYADFSWSMFYLTIDKPLYPYAKLLVEHEINDLIGS